MSQHETIPRDIRWGAALDEQRETALRTVRRALGIPESTMTDCIPDQAMWRRADAYLRAQWLGEWIRSEFCSLERSSTMIVDPLYTVGTRD